MKVLKHDEADRPIHISMLYPDDWHQHLREGAILKVTAPMVAKRFNRAIIMPNLDPPITTVEKARSYRKEVKAASSVKSFTPVMTFYFTDTLLPGEVATALREQVIKGIKYYPRGLTTNSDKGIKDPTSLWTRGTLQYDCLQALADGKGVFLIHAADGMTRKKVHVGDRMYEPNEELDPWDQERHFIEQTIPEIRFAHPKLKISIEHISTRWGAEYVMEHGGKYLGCSVTAHHLLLDRRDIMRGGARPHKMWMPVIQPSEHKEVLLTLVHTDKPFVWLGSDSAPHPRSKKESDCCASGVLMAHAGIELYAEAFASINALDDRFERFASLNGAAFYGFPPTTKKIELVRESWKPQMLFLSDSPEAGSENTSASEQLVPFRLGEDIQWKLVK